MQRIIDFIRLNGEYKSVAPGTFIKSRCKEFYICHLVESGLAVVYLDKDCRHSRKIEGVYVVGLNHLLHPHNDMSFKTIHAANIYAISTLALADMINENDLWSVLASHLSELVFELSNRKYKCKSENTASLVYKVLQSLQKESEEVRISHTVNEYVKDITGLSTSTVVRTMDELKKQGCVEIHNGVLIRLRERK